SVIQLIPRPLAARGFGKYFSSQRKKSWITRMSAFEPSVSVAYSGRARILSNRVWAHCLFSAGLPPGFARSATRVSIALRVQTMWASLSLRLSAGASSSRSLCSHELSTLYVSPSNSTVSCLGNLVRTLSRAGPAAGRPAGGGGAPRGRGEPGARPGCGGGTPLPQQDPATTGDALA